MAEATSLQDRQRLDVLLQKLTSLIKKLPTTLPRLATVWCSNPPNPHQTCTKPEVQCSVQLPSRTEPQWQVQVRDKPEPEPQVHLILLYRSL